MIEFQAPTHSKASVTEWLVVWIARELATSHRRDRDGQVSAQL